MIHRSLFVFFLLLATIVLPFNDVWAEESIQERHTMVALRMVGHQILLRSGDKISLVKPVEKDGDRYKLSFQSNFQFEPDELVVLIDSVIRKTEIAKRYLVEVEACETQQVVYSYEMGMSAKSDMIPCSGRIQPQACYTIFFSILEPGKQILSAQPPVSKSLSAISGAPRNWTALTIFLSVALLISLTFLFFRKKKAPILPTENPDLIAIGSYTFDKRNMTLTVNDQTVELTGKEADLLFLLHASANITIEREVILNVVWGDEGDYAGRTLDVFISKLRKKLETDESLKIVNIRGVGYKLIVNG
jgi:hypothetical protein